MGRKNRNNSSGSISDKPLSRFLSLKEERKRMNRTLSAYKSEMKEAAQFQKSLNGMTNDEKIAANKAKVAEKHPEPDFSTCSKTIRQSRKKIEHEKEMRERTKGQWVSIVSIPMGGINK